MRTAAFLIAAPQSGSGKTTVALAIMAALRRRGLVVAPFKCGPDFIDPGYHRLVTGRPSINLDGWMCPEAFVAETFRLHADGADVAVIEGVMGLFDGLGASSSQGSSAQVAAITGSPVLLVVNARGMAASAAALVKGFAEYDPQVRLAGVIFNNVGSDTHGELLCRAMSEALPRIAVVGCIPRNESLVIPSRHLGLITAEDNPLPPEYLERLADLAEQYLDLDGLLGLGLVAPSPLTEEGRGGGGSATHFADGNFTLPLTPLGPSGSSRQGRGNSDPVRIAVAQDRAFCFVYEDNLRLLREAGAQIVAFSPLDDRELPKDLSGIYLPGGYPELFAEQLAANGAMRAAILDCVKNDMPVYAECGGFIYLTEGMAATESVTAADFVGVFPVRAHMLAKRKALGYRQVKIAADSVIAPAGGSARGHEFHYSEIREMPLQIEQCYRVTRLGQELGSEGYRFRNCLASYIHLHFGSHAGIAPAFVAACVEYRSVLQNLPINFQSKGSRLKSGAAPQL